MRLPWRPAPLRRRRDAPGRRGRLDEEYARQLPAWLQAQEPLAPAPVAPLGARALLGFARRFRAEARPIADWMAELREGERN